MKTSTSLLLPTLPVLCIAIFLSQGSPSCAIAADPEGELIFSDDFERNESQETTDEPGNGWTTNSQSRAKGHKQVDLKDGTMRVFIHPEADHAVVVVHDSVFTDGVVKLRFLLEAPGDGLGLDFADPTEKSVHAGHILAARIDTDKVIFQDLKTGSMRLDIQELRHAKKPLSDEQKEVIRSTQKIVRTKTDIGNWHDLLVKISGDELSISIDGKEIGSFHSPGIAHSAKKLLRLAVPHNAVVDDIQIWRIK